MARWMSGSSFGKAQHLIKPVEQSLEKVSEAVEMLQKYYTPKKKLSYSERLKELKDNVTVDRG